MQILLLNLKIRPSLSPLAMDNYWVSFKVDKKC